MGVFTELAEAPRRLDRRSPAASACIRAPPATSSTRSLRSKFLERRDGNYSNTPATDLFLDKHKPSYIGGILEMANQRLYPLLGPPHRGAAHRPAAERSAQAAADPVRRALCGSRAPEADSSAP